MSDASTIELQAWREAFPNKTPGEVKGAVNAARSLIASVVLGHIMGKQPISTAEAEVNRVMDMLNAALGRVSGEG